MELKELIYDTPYYNNKEKFNLPSFTLINEIDINYKTNIAKEDLTNLFTMTPYYYKTKKEDKEKINGVKELNITIHFTISIYKQN